MPSVAFTTGLFILAACLFSALTAAWVILRIETRQLLQRRPSLSADMTQTTFLFDGKILADASPSALRFIGAPVNRNAAWLKLQTRLELFCPGVATSMSLLEKSGQAFQAEITTAEKSFEMDGRMDGGLVKITFREPDLTDNPAQEFGPADLYLHDLAQFDPVPAWRVDGQGEIVWTNACYKQLGAEAPEKPIQVFPADQPPGRPIQLSEGPETGNWFEITCRDLPDGDQLCFAMPATNTIKAEEALKRFVQTLTKTFAHIPMGIVIFDRDRHLAMFNPAISEMTKLSPEWLSKRPHLNAFLDRLRDTHHLPEPKDYKSWKQRMAALIRAAESGTYEENWSLSTGETFRVSGRPHPEGAVAFLFEDITPTIALQRQVRSELELSQTVFDTLDRAIAAFSSDGELILSNTAFETIWSFDPRELLSRLHISGALDLWQADCKPTPATTAFRHAIQNRENWCGKLVHSEKGGLVAQVSPMARGTLLVSFQAEQSVKLSRNASKQALATH